MPSSGRTDMLPVTRESITGTTRFALFICGIPDMIADLVQLSVTVWPVAHAISHGEPLDEVERLVQRSGTGIHAIQDPLGRTLVQVAALSDQAEHLEWLVTAKGVNITDEPDSEDGLTILELARQNGLQNMVSNTITRLQQLQPTT